MQKSSDSKSSSEEHYKEAPEDPASRRTSHKKKSNTLKGFYVIEKILDKRKEDGEWKYKIKWKDYPIEECTWEPKAHLVDPSTGPNAVQKMIDEFNEEYNKKKNRHNSDRSEAKPKSHKKRIIVDDDDSENSSVQESSHPRMKDTTSKFHSRGDRNREKEKDNTPNDEEFKARKSHHKRKLEETQSKSDNYKLKTVKKYVKESPERKSSKGRKIFTKTKEFPSEKRKLSLDSSSDESKPEEISNPQVVMGKRRRSPIREVSSESSSNNQVYKKHIVSKLRSPSNSSKSKKSNEQQQPATRRSTREERKVKTQKNNQNSSIEQYKYKPNPPKPIKDVAKGNLVTEKGSFLYGDKPKRIIAAKFINDEIICNIEWMTRKDGVTPLCSYFTNTIIKEYDPLFLVNYYETKMILPQPKKNLRNESKEISTTKNGNDSENEQESLDSREKKNEVKQQKLNSNNIVEKFHDTEKKMGLSFTDKLNEIEKKMQSGEDNKFQELEKMMNGHSHVLTSQIITVDDGKKSNQGKEDVEERGKSVDKIKLGTILAEMDNRGGTQ